MGIWKFLASAIASLAWPAAIVIVAWMFRARLADLRALFRGRRSIGLTLFLAALLDSLAAAAAALVIAWRKSATASSDG